MTKSFFGCPPSINSTFFVIAQDRRIAPLSQAGSVIFLGRIRRNFDLDKSVCCSPRGLAHSSIFQSHNPPTCTCTPRTTRGSTYSIFAFPTPAPTAKPALKVSHETHRRRHLSPTQPPFVGHGPTTTSAAWWMVGARVSGRHDCPMGGGCLFKLLSAGFCMPLLGISTHAVGFRRGGCVKATPFRGSAVGSAPSELI